MHYCVHADHFLLPSGMVNAGYLEITNGRFGIFSRVGPLADEVVELPGMIVAPGLIDTHIHGLAGHDVMSGSWNEIVAISQVLPSRGVTSWLPTTSTASVAEIKKVCTTVGIHMHTSLPGSAHVRGLFLEGPFLSEKYKGAMNPNFLISPDLSLFKQWQQAAGGAIRKIALAPELPGALEFCRSVVCSGTKIALGHSNATFDRAMDAVVSGASVFIHTYNAMRPLAHRESGMVGAAMLSHTTAAEIICDGYHVSPEAVRILSKVKGTEHMVLITDCVPQGGLPDGDYDMDGIPVVVANDTVRLKQGGNLAGSTLSLNEAVRNIVEWEVATPEEALRMASENAAYANGLEDSCGIIVKGHEADFIALNQDLDLQATYISGELAYSA